MGKTCVSNLERLNIMQKKYCKNCCRRFTKRTYSTLICKFKIRRLHQLVDYIIGMFVYKLFYKDLPEIFNYYFLPNYEADDHNTRQKDNIHLDVVKTNRPNMTMRHQGAKVWNIVLNKIIMYKRGIAMLRKTLNLICCLRCDVISSTNVFGNIRPYQNYG